MQRGKNVFQLYFDNEKETPFVVARDSWGDGYALLVLRVRPRKYPTGWYGSAIGFAMPNGNNTELWGLPGEPCEINCAGSYQWHAIPTRELTWDESQWLRRARQGEFDEAVEDVVA